MINATTIPDAWFQTLSEVLKEGRRYKVDKGSFKGEERIELLFATIHVTHPYAYPYDNMLPQIRPGLGIPNPVSSGYVEEYIHYLLTDHRESNEEYTYGGRIVPQLHHNIELLKHHPNTNQAILQVAGPFDYILKDPPCLRHIALKVIDGMLYFYPYFRSWDLWGGFPANLAGLAVLQKYIADETDLGVGKIIASSSGLHIYGYVEDMAREVIGNVD